MISQVSLRLLHSGAAVWLSLFVCIMDYQSDRWKKKRSRILRRDKYQCQLSRRYGKMQEAQVVHHIFPASEYPEYQWCDWNLISVTQEVHNRLHDRNTNKLSAMGRELLERTALKQGIDLGVSPRSRNLR